MKKSLRRPGDILREADQIATKQEIFQYFKYGADELLRNQKNTQIVKYTNNQVCDHPGNTIRYLIESKETSLINQLNFEYQYILQIDSWLKIKPYVNNNKLNQYESTYYIYFDLNQSSNCCYQKRMSYSTKKIHNRYDYFEILACFSDSTDEFMLKKHQPIRKTFYIKCVLGPLLALNAYLSHWGPWKWPDNQKLLIFSICFYYLVSYIFGRLDLVDKNEGALVYYLIMQIGEYKTGEKQNRKYLMTVSDNKIDYILEQADSQTSKILRKKCFVYTDYFTQEGEFLEDLYHRHLGGFLKNKEA